MKRSSLLKTAVLSLAAISTLAASPVLARGGPDPADRQAFKTLRSATQETQSPVTRTKTQTNKNEKTNGAKKFRLFPGLRKKN